MTRVFLAKDRETGRAKGFAFISFADRTDAAKACEKIDGCTFPPIFLRVSRMLDTDCLTDGYGHLILRVEFAKRAT